MSNLIKLLAIDTSTDACSVALYLEGKITERYEWAPKAHARLLLPMIDNLLKELGVTLGDLDVFAFGRGPGSFTGIRIACSVIQALSFGMSKPIVPISTLRALAQGAYREWRVTQVFANLDARMGEIYWGLFAANENGIMEAVSEERVEPLQKVVLPSDSWYSVTGFPHAGVIAELAVFEYGRGYYVSAIDALPVYLRDEVVKVSTRS